MDNLQNDPRRRGGCVRVQRPVRPHFGLVKNIEKLDREKEKLRPLVEWLHRL